MRPFHRPASAPERLVLDDLLYMAGKTLSMQQLLIKLPEQVCGVFRFSRFQIFLRDGMHYKPEPAPADAALGGVRFASSCSMLAHLKRELRPVPVRTVSPDAWRMLATAEELAALHQLDAQLLLPLHGRTGLIGFATVTRDTPGGFSGNDLRQLQSLGEQLGPGLEAAQFQKSLSDEAVRHADADRELELAREVQERLLPQRLPAVPGLDLGSAYRSAQQVGGDYYDVFLTHEGVCCVIADVSGKGISAALLMATLRASLRSLMLQTGGLPAIVAELNRLLYQASSASRYATFAVLVYDPATSKLTYVNAGHNPPMLQRRGEVLRLTCGGPVLGLLPETVYEQGSLTLEQDDLLVLYTDGVTEQTNPEKAEWDETGLMQAMRKYAHGHSAAETAERIVAAMDDFARRCTQTDDLTLLVLRRTANAWRGST